jgi:hypothetical protein
MRILSDQPDQRAKTRYSARIIRGQLGVVGKLTRTDQRRSGALITCEIEEQLTFPRPHNRGMLFSEIHARRKSAPRGAFG